MITRFCLVFSTRATNRLLRRDLEAMAAAFVIGDQKTASKVVVDPSHRFGIAAVGPEALAVAESEEGITVHSGFVRSGQGREEWGHQGSAFIGSVLEVGGSPDALSGEFALAHWSRITNELTLATDPLGKYPLFVLCDEATGVVVAGTEAKAVLAHPVAKRNVDTTGLAVYLHQRQVPPPYSVYQGLKRLHFGEVLSATSAGLRSSMSWSYPPTATEVRTVAEWGDFAYGNFVAMLRRVTAGHNKVALMLGAGLDSSLIYGILKTALPDLPVIPITAHYEEGRHKSPNLDLPFARQLAQHWGDSLVEVELSRPKVGPRLETLIRQTDQPFFNFGNHVAYDAMASAALSRGTTLLLTGQAGGESFRGTDNWVRVLEANARGETMSTDEISALYTRPEGLDSSRISALLPGAPVDVDAAYAACYRPLTERVRSPDIFDQTLYGASQANIREHIFSSTATTMALRPLRVFDAFYDWETFCLMAQVPSEFKGSRDPRMQRAYFHQHLRHLIPEFVWQRPKRGLPGYSLTNGDFPHLSGRLLSRELVAKQGVFAPDSFQKAIGKKRMRLTLLLAQVWLDVHLFRTEETMDLLSRDLKAATH